MRGVTQKRHENCAVDQHCQRPDLIRAGLQYLVDAVVQNKIAPSIASVLALRDAEEAHRILEDREAKGTVLLDTTI